MYCIWYNVLFFLSIFSSLHGSQSDGDGIKKNNDQNLYDKHQLEKKAMVLCVHAQNYHILYVDDQSYQTVDIHTYLNYSHLKPSSVDFEKNNKESTTISQADNLKLAIPKSDLEQWLAARENEARAKTVHS